MLDITNVDVSELINCLEDPTRPMFNFEINNKIPNADKLKFNIEEKLNVDKITKKAVLG
ncbi:MAG: hypothetical protein ACI86H_002608, partial [bacterium]